MSIWEAHDVEAKVRGILSEVAARSKHDHHFDNPFITAYQLAIELNKRHPEIAEELGYKVGGQGTNEQNSLAQYIAQQMSRNIKSGKTPDIEGAFLSSSNLKDLVFNNNGEELVSSLTKSQHDDVSMFRLV